MIYYFDVNILGEMFKYYPSRIFSDLWERLDELIAAGQIRVPDETYREIASDEAREWLTPRKGQIVCATTEVELDCLGAIGSSIPSFVDHSKPRSDADQPLVAHAMACNLQAVGEYASGPAMILTNERRRKGNETRLRIPDACDHFGVRCGRFLDFIEDLGLRFALV